MKGLCRARENSSIFATAMYRCSLRRHSVVQKDAHARLSVRINPDG